MCSLLLTAFPLFLYINIPQAMYKSRQHSLLVCRLRHRSDLVATDLSSNLRDKKLKAKEVFKVWYQRSHHQLVGDDHN